MNRLTRTLAILGVCAAAALSGAVFAASPALADDGALVAKAKTEITARIDLRLAALSRFDARLTAAKHLTDAHEATLKDLVADDRAGLTDLKAKVAGETTLAALRTDAKSMVNDYRIFILVGPKVRLTIASDAETAAIARLNTLHDKLADLVAQAKAAGKDTAAAEQDLADMEASIGKAGIDIDGQAAKLLALQPGPDGTALRAQVLAVRAALGQGRANIKGAIAEAKHVRAFLKS